MRTRRHGVPARRAPAHTTTATLIRSSARLRVAMLGVAALLAASCGREPTGSVAARNPGVARSNAIGFLAEPAIASLLVAPLTALAGPVVSYNVAALLMPPLAAWTAFLLCHHLTRALWPSVAGGYLFGFSAYLLGQQLGHLHMTSVFLLPVIALLVVRYLQGGLAGRPLVVRLGATLAGARFGPATGAALAALVMGLPLMVRAIRLAIEQIDPRLEGAAATLGAAAGLGAGAGACARAAEDTTNTNNRLSNRVRHC